MNYLERAAEVRARLASTKDVPEWVAAFVQYELDQGDKLIEHPIGSLSEENLRSTEDAAWAWLKSAEHALEWYIGLQDKRVSQVAG